MTADQINKNRFGYLKAFYEKRKRNVVAYYSGFWQFRAEKASIFEGDVGPLVDAVRHLDHSRGLDLLLHTPGGSIGGAEAMGNYLRRIFGTNIEVFVPMTAMSAGTMIACISRKIHMGKQSSLGPIDPQLDNFSMGCILDNIEDINKQVADNPSKSDFFAALLKDKYELGLVPLCKQSIDLSKEIVSNWLKTGMFCEDGGECLAKCVVEKLSDYKEMKSHNRKIGVDKATEIGLKVASLETDREIEEIVLNIHKSYMETITAYRAYKIVENHSGVCVIYVDEPSEVNRTKPNK